MSYIKRPDNLKINWADLIRDSQMPREEWAEEFGVTDKSLKERVGRGGLLTARELKHLDELTHGMILGPSWSVEHRWVSQALKRNSDARRRRYRAQG